MSERRRLLEVEKRLLALIEIVEAVHIACFPTNSEAQDVARSVCSQVRSKVREYVRDAIHELEATDE